MFIYFLLGGAGGSGTLSPSYTLSQIPLQTSQSRVSVTVSSASDGAAVTRQPYSINQTHPHLNSLAKTPTASQRLVNLLRAVKHAMCDCHRGLGGGRVKFIH